MKLEPAVQAHLDAGDMTGFAEADIVGRRTILTREIDRMFALFGLDGPAVADVRDHRVPVEGGTLLIRSYHPPADGPLPVHVLLHGGGWTTGSIEETVCDATARHRAVGADCVTVLVEYRLAPEHPFPTAVYDTVAAVRWVLDHADSLGVDPMLLTLGGSSAGANLAAAALVADPDLPVTALMLDVPALDLRLSPDDLDIGLDPALTAVLVETLADAVRDYLAGDPRLAENPVVSPALVADLRSWPETHMFNAELDPLRVGAEHFADRLREAGVPVEVTCYRGALHGSPILTATWATARQWHEDVLSTLRDVHHRAGAGRTVREAVGG